MEKYLTKWKAQSSSTPVNQEDSQKQNCVTIDISDLPKDPGERPRISEYDPNIREEVRRAYLLNGPCQPRTHSFPQTIIGGLRRRFKPSWFDEFPNWFDEFPNLFPSVVDVLDAIVDDGATSDKKGQAFNLLEVMQSFEFVFNLHLMRILLGITNDLSQALQRKDQDIVNAMTLVRISKERLQSMRNEGWTSLMDEVSSFCDKNNIEVPNMDDVYLPRGRSRRRVHGDINLHHYRNDTFNMVIDIQIQELNSRFNEISSELLICVSCLNPSDSFVAFEKQKLIRLAQFYPMDFSNIELMALSDQLDTFVIDVRSSVDFSELKGISDLAQKMIDTRRHNVYTLVYRLLRLALILPVATATVERAFSAMKIVKNRLRNRMGDQWLNDSLVVYIEKDVFDAIPNEVIMKRFQNMKNRRGHL